MKRSQLLLKVIVDFTKTWHCPCVTPLLRDVRAKPIAVIDAPLLHIKHPPRRKWRKVSITHTYTIWWLRIPDLPTIISTAATSSAAFLSPDRFRIISQASALARCERTFLPRFAPRCNSNPNIDRAVIANSAWRSFSWLCSCGQNTNCQDRSRNQQDFTHFWRPSARKDRRPRADARSHMMARSNGLSIKITNL